MAQVRTVAGNFFTTLRTRSRYGRLLYDSDDAVGGVVPAVVSHLFWEKTLGGRQTAIGRSIAINGQSCVIAGVLEPGFFGCLATTRRSMCR